MQDPEHKWHQGPTEEFRYPSDAEIDLLRDFFLARYKRSLTDDELKWLASLVSDYWEWSRTHCRPTEARIAALRCLKVLLCVDEVMSSSKDAARSWSEIAFALELPSIVWNGMTQRELAASRGLTDMAVSKAKTKFLRLVNLGDPHG